MRHKQIRVFRNNNLAATQKIARRKKRGRVQKNSQKTTVNVQARNMSLPKRQYGYNLGTV